MTYSHNKHEIPCVQCIHLAFRMCICGFHTSTQNMVQVSADNGCVNLWKKAWEWKLSQPPHRLDGNLIFETKHAAGTPSTAWQAANLNSSFISNRSVLPCGAVPSCCELTKEKISNQLTMLKAPAHRAMGDINIIELLVFSQLNFGTLTKIIEFIW